MGLKEDVLNILKFLPEDRQTALFSATLNLVIRSNITLGEIGLFRVNKEPNKNIDRKHRTYIKCHSKCPSMC